MRGSKLIKAVQLVLTLKCERSMRLVSEALDRDLSLGERIALRLHLFICRACRRARRQLFFLHEGLRRRRNEEGDAERDTCPAPVGLDPERRERMIRKLRDADAEADESA